MLSMNAIEFIAGFLEKNPNRRLTDFEEIKESEWLENIDWEEIRAKTIIPQYIPEFKNEGSNLDL